LAPVYAVAGNNIGVFVLFVSLLFVGLGMAMVLFYRQYFSVTTAFVLAFIFLYNPQMVLFKHNVMSDIPFAVLLVLIVWGYIHYGTKERKPLIWLALATGLLLTIRPAGIMFAMAAVVDQLVGARNKRHSLREALTASGVMVVVPVLFYFVLNSVLFKIPADGSLNVYLNLFANGNMLTIIPDNFAHYVDVFRYMYTPEVGVFKGFALVLGSVVMVMTLIGLVKRFQWGASILEWFYVLYGLMLMVYPNYNGAFRFMMPLGFLTLFYAAVGFESVQIFNHVAAQKKVLVCGLLALVFYVPGIFNIVRGGNNVLEGPQQKSAQEAFGFIKKNVPHEAVVVFAKPRALCLYGECRSMADPFTLDPTDLHVQIMKGNAGYLLVCDSLTEENMKRYVRVMEPRLRKEWGNKDFALYRILPFKH